MARKCRRSMSCSAVRLAWSLGTLSYYLLPTLGPGIAYWPEYTALSHTGTTDLMNAIVRADVALPNTAAGGLRSRATLTLGPASTSAFECPNWRELMTNPAPWHHSWNALAGSGGPASRHPRCAAL